MKDKKTIINSILIVPYSIYSCAYYINDGERHSNTYEEIVRICSEIAPLLILQVMQKIDRKIPFYIDVKNNTLSELSTDRNLEMSILKKKMINFNIGNALESIKRKK